MRNITLGMTVLFLVLLVAAYVHKQGWAGSQQAASVMESGVDWGITKADLNKQTKVSFTMHDSKGEGLRGLNDAEQNAVRAIIVPPDMKEYAEVQPSFIGKGRFTFSYTFRQKGEYAIFLYEKNNQAGKSFADTRVTVGEEKQTEGKLLSKRGHMLQTDSVLTTKIGPYDTSLVFNTLQAGGKETLTFQFPNKKETLGFRSQSGEASFFLFVNEDKDELIYAVADEAEGGKNLSLSVTFPKEGMYKMWGTFYINGREYNRAFVMLVGKKP